MNVDRNRILRGLLLLSVGVGIIFALRIAGGTAPDRLTLDGPTMGTSWRVVVTPTPGARDAGLLRREIEATLNRINTRMSTWDPESELSRFNAWGGTDWFPVSGETVAVVATALEISALTDGAFDVTVGPLVTLWGFGAAPASTTPSADALSVIREHVGWQQIETRASPPALRKSHGAIQIDLSAIAKGYAVDAVHEVLARAGAGDFLVEVGGELRGQGRNPDGRSWTVAIEKPQPGARAVQRALALGDRAIATSGDYRNVVELDGTRYSHTIDPRTGRPVPLGVASASVVADSTMLADAWATALMVLGPDEGPALARKHGLAAHLLVHDGDGLREITTPTMTRHLLDGDDR